MKTVLLLGGRAAGQRVEVHGCMKTVMGRTVTPPIDTIYNVVPLLSHGEVHWFGVTDGADPLLLLIAGYGGANAALVQAMVEQAAFGDTEASAHLAATGSYSRFDEPSSVHGARLALTMIGYKP